MQVALDTFGRVVLPKALRDGLGLRPGDRLDAVEEDNQVILRPVRATQVVRSKDGVLVFSGRGTGDLQRAVSAVREERLSKLSVGGDEQ